jgi:hypothetical protein
MRSCCALRDAHSLRLDLRQRVERNGRVDFTVRAVRVNKVSTWNGPEDVAENLSGASLG